MEKEQLKNDIEGQKAITNALMDLLNAYPVLKSTQIGRASCRERV